MGGGQFVYAVENRLRRYGHNDENISRRVFGFESNLMRLNFAVNRYKLVGNYNVVDTMSFLQTQEFGMKFNVILGNPPFSLAGNKTGKKGRAKNLYPDFYKKAVDLADHVCMIVPDTHRQNTKFNEFIRANTNKIMPISDDVFDVNINTWCLIKDGSDTNVDEIPWSDLHEMPEQKVVWAKGKVNVTNEKEVLENKPGPYTVYHKVNGSGLQQSTTDNIISDAKLFPNKGYAVIMPQQIQNHGWTRTEIVKCNGKQVATNGVNLAFVDTKKEAEYLVEYMKIDEFVNQALEHCGGMRNMTLGAMQKIDMISYDFK